MIKVVNSGNVNLVSGNLLSQLAVTDEQMQKYSSADADISQPGTTDFVTMAAPGEMVVYRAVYKATQDDYDRGYIQSNAIITATPPLGMSDLYHVSNAVSTALGREVSLTLQKRATGGRLVAGEEISFTLTAKNTGTVALNQVTIVDDDVVFKPETVNGIHLDPGDEMVIYATHTVTEQEAQSGVYVNTAQATASAPDDLVNPVQATAQYTVYASGLELTKDVSGTFEQGALLNYTLRAKNTGGATLTDVEIIDSLLDEASMNYTIQHTDNTTTAATSAGNRLASSETLIATGTYQVSEADVQAGKITNRATATATTPEGATLSAEATKELTGTAQLTLTKTANKTTLKTGESIVYTLTAKNTGAVLLKEVAISEALTGMTLNETYETDADNVRKTAPTDNQLMPGESLVVVMSYQVQQVDVNKGILTNSANASAKDPAGQNISAPTAVLTIEDAPTSQITLNKAITGTFAAGSTLRFTVTAKNSGTATLNAVAIEDNFANLTHIAQSETDSTGQAKQETTDFVLEPGESLVWTAEYVVSQSDYDKGSLTNTAHVSASSLTDANVTDSATTTVSATNRTAVLTLTKTASVATFIAGDDIIYTVTAKNEGTTTLSNVTIIDAKASSPLYYKNNLSSSNNTTLAPGEELVMRYTYRATQQDVNIGTIDNRADATATPPTGLSLQGTLRADLSLSAANRTADAYVTKSISGNLVLGEEVTMTVRATNTGTTTLSNADITDSFSNLFNITKVKENAAQNATTPSDGTLQPQETLIYTAKYIVTQADVDANKITNTATFNAAAPSDLGAVTKQAQATLLGTATPSATLTMTVDKTSVSIPNETISVRITVQNTGVVTLTELKFLSEALGYAPTPMTIVPSKLGPGERVSFDLPYTVKASDLTGSPIIFNGALSANTEYLSSVSRNATVSANTVAPILSSLKITIKDAVTSALLPMAVYQLTLPDQSTQSYQSDSEGIISLNNLAPGSYSLIMTAPPSGYRSSDTLYPITVGYDGKTTIASMQTSTYNISLTPLVLANKSVLITKVDSITPVPLKDAVFALYKTAETPQPLPAPAATEEVSLLLAERQTLITQRDLTLQQQQQSLEILLQNKKNTTQTDPLLENEIAALQSDINTTQASYQAQIDALDSKIAAAKATSVTTAAASDTLIGTYTTKDDGIISVTGLSDGAYYFIETTPPAGYVLNENNRYSFTLSQAQMHYEQTIKNTPAPITPAVINITLDVLWKDVVDFSNRQPVTVTLLTNNAAPQTKTVAVGDAFATFENLREKDDSGNAIAYTLTAQSLSGYQSTLSLTAPNRYQLLLVSERFEDKIDLSLSAEWESEPNVDEISVRLRRNSIVLASLPVLQKNQNWQTTISGLPKYDHEGNLYQYDLTELPTIEGYLQPLVTVNNHAFVIEYKKNNPEMPLPLPTLPVAPPTPHLSNAAPTPFAPPEYTFNAGDDFADTESQITLDNNPPIAQSEGIQEKTDYKWILIGALLLLALLGVLWFIKRRLFFLAWRTGDVYALPLKSSAAEALGLKGEWIILQKIDEYKKDASTPYAGPIVRLKLSTNARPPQNTEEFDQLSYLHLNDPTSSATDSSVYRLLISMQSKKEVPEELIYLGNFATAHIPENDTTSGQSTLTLPTTTWDKLEKTVIENYLFDKTRP